MCTLTTEETRMQTLDNLWCELLEFQPSKQDLREIIERVDSLRKKAGEQLLKQGPSNEDLLFIIEHVREISEKAGKRLLKQGPSNDELRKVMYKVESLREKACKQMLKQNPSNADLQLIISREETLREEAGEHLLKQLPTEDDLFLIIKKVERLREKAWKKLTKSTATPSKTVLCNIMYEVESLSDVAGLKLLEISEPTNEHILKVMLHIRGLRKAAWQKLLLDKPTVDDLRFVVNKVDDLQIIAGRYLLKTVSDEDYYYNYAIQVMGSIKGLRQEIWKDLLKRQIENPMARIFMDCIDDQNLREHIANYLLQNPDNSDLCCIIRNVPNMREKAGHQLLQQKPENDDLSCIIRYVESLREDAWQKLLSQNPTNEDLRYVMQHAENLREEAEGLVVKTKSDILKEIYAL